MTLNAVIILKIVERKVWLRSCQTQGSCSGRHNSAVNPIWICVEQLLWHEPTTCFPEMFQCLFCNDFLRKQWRRNVAVASLGQEASKQQPATPGPVKDACWDRMVKTSKVCSFQRDLSIYESKCMYTMDMNEPMCEVSNDKWTLNHWKCEKKVTSTPGDELSRSQPQTTSNTRSQPWPPHQLCKSHTPW